MLGSRGWVVRGLGILWGGVDWLGVVWYGRERDRDADLQHRGSQRGRFRDEEYSDWVVNGREKERGKRWRLGSGAGGWKLGAERREEVDNWGN